MQDPFADIPIAGQSAPINTGTPTSQQTSEADQIRLDMAQAAEDRAAAKEQREIERKAKGFDAAESERKAGAFLIRALGANASFERTGEGARALPQQALRDAFPDFENYFIAGSRQVADSAQDEFIAASLRQDSGAAVPPEELERQRRIYFPMPGDGEEVIAQKAEARLRVVLGLEQSAGRLAAGSRALFEKNFPDLVAQNFPREATKRDKTPAGVRLRVDSLGDDAPFDRAKYLQDEFGIGQGQETRLIGMLNANIGNPNLTADMVNTIYSMTGAPPPSPDDMEQMASDMREGRAPATGINTSAGRDEYYEQLNQREQQRTGSRIDEQVGMGNAAAAGVSQGQTLAFVDEAAGVGEAAVGLLAGQDPIMNYQIERDRMRLWNEYNSEAHPVIHTGSALVGGVTTGALGAAGRVKTTADAAKVGAVEGGLAGFGSGEGLADSAVGGLVGSGLGAAGGAAVQSVGNRVSQSLATRSEAKLVDNASEIADAGARQNVTTRRVDVDPGVREARGRVGQTQEGRQALRDAADADLAEIEGALVESLGGSVSARTEGGGAIQAGVKLARQGLRQRADRLYKIAHSQAGRVQARPEASLNAIEDQIEELAEQGAELNAESIAYLHKLRRDITRRGGLSIEGLRAQRTSLRKRLENAGVYTSDFERRVKSVLDGVSEDIAKSLEAFPEAAANYAEADGLWRQQAELGSDIGDALLGRRGDLAPGDAAAKLLGWARKDPRRLMRLLDEVDDETRGEVRSLVAGQLGRLPNGQFQLGAFLKATGGGDGAKITPANMKAVFGEEGMKAIRDLRILSQAKTDAASASNYSNTGSSVRKAVGGLRRMLLGLFGISAVDGTGAAALAGGGAVVGGELVEKLGNQRTIRMLLDPTFTNALRTAPDTANPKAIDRWFGALRRSASRHPALMADLDAFERMLVDFANDNSVRVAAEPKGASRDNEELKQ